MALADIPTHGQPRRLDSWKEIADYLGRDTRTATRWESQGLPVHRVPGGKGASVFAFTDEIDVWMRGRQPEAATDIQAPATAAVTAQRRTPNRIVAVGVASALMLTLAAAVFVMRGAGTPDLVTLHVTATPTEIALAVESGTPQVIHRFQPDLAVLIRGATARVTDLNNDGDADVITGISFFTDSAGRVTRGGELLNLATDGGIHWRFAFDDVLTFRDGKVSGPWAMSDWQALPDGPHARVAAAAHDYTWWASMVAVIDGNGRRRGTFVNPGWIESLAWLGPNRLAAAGFSNPRNEAMLALIDPDAANGQAPGSTGTPFACASCSAAAPLVYATFPRSELNLLTGSPFNRADVAVVGDRILVTTSETESSNANAIYEFDRDLRFVRARYSAAYWDAHARLEREGRLTHTRETCPERDGPAAIHVWDPAAGQWRTLAPA